MRMEQWYHLCSIETPATVGLGFMGKAGSISAGVAVLGGVRPAFKRGGSKGLLPPSPVLNTM